MPNPYRRLPAFSGDHISTAKQVEKNTAAYTYQELLKMINVLADREARERRGWGDLTRSAGFAATARDGTTWNEQWANLTSWTTAGTTPVVSGGKLFAAGGVSAANRAITFASVAAMRGNFLQVIKFKDGLAAGRSTGVYWTTSSASTMAAGGGGASSVGVQIDVSASSRVPSFNVFGTLFTMPAMAAGDRDYIVGIFADEVRGMGLYFASVDGTYAPQYMPIPKSSISAWLPTFVALLGTDIRGSGSATGWGPTGFRLGSATIDPRTGVEGVATTIQVGTASASGTSERSMVMRPATYDSRMAQPLFISCHGGGGNYTEAVGLCSTFAAAGFLVASGDFRSADGGLVAVGSPASIDAVVSLYQWVRDRYNIGPVFIGGYSMGGLTAVRCLQDGRIPNIAGVIAHNSPMSMDAVWQVRANSVWAPLWPSAKAAWGVGDDTEATWNAATGAYDPLTLDLDKLQGVPLHLASSPSDTTAPEASFMLPFRDRLIANNYPVTYVADTGAHGDASGWDTTALLNWMLALAYT